jgi:hypothetical protein
VGSRRICGRDVQSGKATVSLGRSSARGFAAGFHATRRRVSLMMSAIAWLVRSAGATIKLLGGCTQDTM